MRFFDEKPFLWHLSVVTVEVHKPGVFTVKDDMSCATDYAASEVKLYELCNVALEENDWSASFFDCLCVR